MRIAYKMQWINPVSVHLETNDTCQEADVQNTGGQGDSPMHEG
jgi:hypothetical protein